MLSGRSFISIVAFPTRWNAAVASRATILCVKPSPCGAPVRRRIPTAASWSICLGLDEAQIRVIVPSIGGGFGPKAPISILRTAVISAAAMLLGRPVKWIEDRREHLITTTQERDQFWDVEMALDAEGRILGLRGQDVS